MFEKYWINIDAILVTHKHKDHCLSEVINEIIKRDNAKFYTTKEVIETHGFTDVNKIQQNDVFYIDDIKIEVTRAIHGFITPMKSTGAEVKENIGFMIDDQKTRLYITSDTINFCNDYKCDVLAMPFNGNGITLGILEGIDFIKDINPKLVLPIHLQHPIAIMNPNIEELKKVLEKEDIVYKILGINESIEV